VSRYHNNDEKEVAALSVKALAEYHYMEALSTWEWEKYKGRRYFKISKAITNRLRHGERKHNSYVLDMDSAGWADAEVTIANVNHENGLDATFDDLVLLAVTGPKGRLQLGIVVDGLAENERVIASFVRVNQGSSIPFVREDRVAHVISSLDDMKDRVSDVWHGTRFDLVPEILRAGLLPGGPRGTRNSVYLSPLAPWDDEFKEVSRSGSDAFVQIDPVKLMELVPKGYLRRPSFASTRREATRTCSCGTGAWPEKFRHLLVRRSRHISAEVGSLETVNGRNSRMNPAEVRPLRAD